MGAPRGPQNWVTLVRFVRQLFVTGVLARAFAILVPRTLFAQNPEDHLSSWQDGLYSSEYDPPPPAETVGPFAGIPKARVVLQPKTTAGGVFLYLAVLFVVGISVGALMGKIDPVAGAFIVLGSEVLGTIAFFLTYYIGRRE